MVDAADDDTTRRMRFACWKTKSTNTHSEHVTLIAFPRQQWLRERASVLRYTYIACLVHFVRIFKFLNSFLTARRWSTTRAETCSCVTIKEQLAVRGVCEFIGTGKPSVSETLTSVES